MEMLLLPIGLIVGGYTITRRSGIDIPAIVGELKAVFGTVFLVVHLRRIEPFIGNDVTHPFVSPLLPTWLEWTQIGRPRVPEFSVSIVSVE